MKKQNQQKGSFLTITIITLAVLGMGGFGVYAVLQTENQTRELPKVENKQNDLNKSLLAALQREGKVGIDGSVFIQEQQGMYVRASLLIGGGIRSFTVFAIRAKDSWSIIDVTEKFEQSVCEKLARSGFRPKMIKGCIVKHSQAKTVKQVKEQPKEDIVKESPVEVIGFVTEKDDGSLELTSQGESIEIVLSDDATTTALTVGDMVVVQGTLLSSPSVTTEVRTNYIQLDSYEEVEGNDSEVVLLQQEIAQEENDIYVPQSVPVETFDEDESDGNEESGNGDSSDDGDSGSDSSNPSDLNAQNDLNENGVNTQEQEEQEDGVNEEEEEDYQDSLDSILTDPFEGAPEIEEEVGVDDSIEEDGDGDGAPVSELEQEILDLLEEQENQSGDFSGNSGDQNTGTNIKRLND